MLTLKRLWCRLFGHDARYEGELLAAACYELANLKRWTKPLHCDRCGHCRSPYE